MNNIPYNLARRLCTITSDTEILDLRLTEFQDLLLQRKYPIYLIQSGINKANCHERKRLQQVKNKPVNYVVPYISTHNLRNPEVFTLIKNNMPILKENPDMKKI